jgi:hypothetical protein
MPIRTVGAQGLSPLHESDIMNESVFNLYDVNRSIDILELFFFIAIEPLTCLAP